MAKTTPLNPSAWQAAYKQGMASAGPKWAAAIQACTVNPMQLAAAQADTAVNNYAAAKGKMVAGLNAASTSYWKSQSAAGQSAFAAGGTKGATKYLAKMQGQVAVMQAQRSAVTALGPNADPVSKVTASLQAQLQAKQAAMAA